MTGKELKQFLDGLSKLELEKEVYFKLGLYNGSQSPLHRARTDSQPRRENEESWEYREGIFLM